LQLTVADSGLGAAFDDVAALAAGCGFADCTHHAEPRCAVMAAAHSGALDAARLESYRKLQRELAWANTRHDESAGRLEKQRWKAIHKAARQYRPRG
jgi:ribosome biogenesis GTPase